MKTLGACHEGRMRKDEPIDPLAQLYAAERVYRIGRAAALRAAIELSGSVRAAAKMLDKSHTTLAAWIAEPTAEGAELREWIACRQRAIRQPRPDGAR